MRDDDDPDWGSGHSDRDTENGWHLEINRLCREGDGGDKKAASFLVWGPIEWLQATETQLKLQLTPEEQRFEL